MNPTKAAKRAAKTAKAPVAPVAPKAVNPGKVPKVVNPTKAAKRAAKTGKVLTPEQQAKRNAGMMASKTKKASGPVKQGKMTKEQKALRKNAQKGMTPQQKMNAQKKAQAQARAAKPPKVKGKQTQMKGPNINVGPVNLNAVAELSAVREPKDIIIETKGYIDPASVQKALQAGLAKIGLSVAVSKIAPADPTPNSGAPAGTAGDQKGIPGTARDQQRTPGAEPKLASINVAGDKPFDFASLVANPGIPIELKGRQLYSRFPTLGPGQVIHNLGDTQSGVSYSEFAVDDDGLRIFRVVGTPSQIAAGSKTIANRIQLEKITTGPGGYVTLLRDLDDEEARLIGTKGFYQGRIASYEASLPSLDAKEQKPIRMRLDPLRKSLKRTIADIDGIQKTKIAFKASRNAAAAAGAPLSGGRRNTRRR